jgi:SAM-dependent methyltransferase
MVPKKILKDPTQYYLDYACGKGTILLHGLEILFVSLKDSILDPQERLEHIIFNQLYGVDINKGQIDIARSAFKRILKDPTSDVNIMCEDSLEKDFHKMKKKFNLITNVPFQNGKDTHFWAAFRGPLNSRLKDILNYKIIVSPNFNTITSKDVDIENLAIYHDVGNIFESIKLPSGVCVTREDPIPTTTVTFRDLTGNETSVKKEDFVVVANSSVLPLIKKIQKTKTLDTRYIHGKDKLADSKENKNGDVFYVDKVGETDKDVKGFKTDSINGTVSEGSFVVFAYNASGDPLDVGNKKLGPTKVLTGKYIFSTSVVALKFNTIKETANCKQLLDSTWAKQIISSVKYATNNSKMLLSVLPDIDFTKEFKEKEVSDLFI